MFISVALRNVLVTVEEDRYIAKISDLGMSQFGEFYGVEDAPLPIRWCAPEVLKKRKFSHKSDVWAFGVSKHSDDHLL